MSIRTGFNITSSDLKSMLEKRDRQADGIRSWQKLFGNASIGYNAMSDKLTTDYAAVINEAYISNLAREQAIMSTGLSAGSTRELVSAQRADLRNAYETYIANYRQAQEELNTNYTKEVSDIDTELTGRAENFAKLYENAYKYLEEELYTASNEYGELWKQNNLLRSLVHDPVQEALEQENWYSSYLANIDNYPTAKDGYEQYPGGFIAQKYNEMQAHLASQGIDTTSRLLSWNELSPQLFNDDGSLTQKGVEFYDAIFNFLPEDYVTANGEAVRSFDKWLGDTDAELRNWWVSPDVYNYTLAGTNVGTSKSMVGLRSTDSTYRQGDYGKFEDINAKTNPGSVAKSSLEKAQKELTDVQSKLEALGGKPSVWKMLFSSDPKYEQANVLSEAIPAYEKNVSKAWSDYQKAMYAENNTVQTNFKKLIGNDEYERFKKEYQSLFDEYERLSSIKSYSEADAKAYTDLYKEMIAAMQKFFETHKSKNDGY